MYRNDGTSKKRNCIELIGTEGVQFSYVNVFFFNSVKPPGFPTGLLQRPAYIKRVWSPFYAPPKTKPRSKPRNFGAKTEMANKLKSQSSHSPSMRQLRCKFTRIVCNHDQLKIAFHQLKSQIESGLKEVIITTHFNSVSSSIVFAYKIFVQL